MPGVHAVLTHDDVPGREDLRARVRRPAGARDRPRPLPRRAGRARRRRPPRAGAPRGRADRRRVRAARAGHRHGARDRAAAASTTRPTAGHGYRDDPRPNVVRYDRDPPRRPRRGGRRRRSSGVYEVGIQDQAFLGPESGLAVPDGEGGVDLYVATQWLHVDRDQVAPCLGLPPEQVRLHLAGVGGAFGGREDLSMQIHACAARAAHRAGR